MPPQVCANPQNGLVSSPAETRSRTSIGTNPDAGYDPPLPVPFKKQVSFSKDVPEVRSIPAQLTRR